MHSRGSYEFMYDGHFHFPWCLLWKHDHVCHYSWLIGQTYAVREI